MHRVQSANVSRKCDCRISCPPPRLAPITYKTWLIHGSSDCLTCFKSHSSTHSEAEKAEAAAARPKPQAPELPTRSDAAVDSAAQSQDPFKAFATSPKYQGGGHGKALLQWGIERATEEQVALSVISAHGRDGFYNKLGFTVESGTASDGYGNPLAGLVKGGKFWWKEDHLKSAKA